MCGLSAFVDFVPASGLAPTLLAMHARIPHRGPDGEGFLLVDGAWHARTLATSAQARAAVTAAPRVGLAFRWLQIQDKSAAGAQPMASRDGTVHLVFNGEIYNFRALRDELRGLGHAFRSAGDTEVILAAYAQWGTAMFERLDGMWAIVLVDLRTRRLVASRDRFGIKPLFYRFDGSRLLLASEAKQLLAAGTPPAANVAAVTRFIRGARPETPEQTFFASIASFPAAAYCDIDLQRAPGALAFTPYWCLPRRDKSPPLGLEDARARLDSLLQTTVDEHMVAQVPVGILVSGGLDSSLVAAMARPGFAARSEPGVGFSMVLGREEGALDESPHIERVVRAFGYRSFTARLDPQWLRAEMDRITLAQEEPVPGIAVAAQYLVHQLAARHGARVVLDGQGADEVFGGYPRHQMAWLAAAVRGREWGALALEAACLLAHDARVLRIALQARRLAPAPVDADFIRSEVRSAVLAEALDPSLRRDVLRGNLRAVLALTDRNAMAHSVEARVPYVSRGVVEFAFGLPDRLKVGAGRRKRILARVAARHLPEQIVRRRDRIGFGAPVARWLRGALAAELRELHAAPALAGAGCLDSPKLGRYVQAFLAGGHEDAGTIWRLYAVERWARLHAVTGL